MPLDVGKLDAVPVRSVWPDEAYDLTPWLAANPELLAEALGMELELEGSEVAVGPFSADLLFRDVSSGTLVVVENMINPTDHDHVGKMITYAAGLGATYAVLLAERFRPEHRSALTWLNSISGEDFGFFGLTLEVWRIGESAPAPRLNVEVQPDDWSKSLRAAASHELTDTQSAYRDFWSLFLPEFHEAHPGWSRAAKPPKGSWINFPSAHRSVKFVGTFCKPEGVPLLRVEAYVDGGDGDENNAVFDELTTHRTSLEGSLPGLEWDRLDDKRACRIALYFEGPMHVTEREKWDEARPWLIQRLGEMRRSFDPVLAHLAS